MVPDNTADRQHLMEADEIAALIQKLGKMIYEDNRDVPPDQLILIGIQRGGVPLAERLVGEIASASGVQYSWGTLDIAMYRDDIGLRKTLPQIFETRIPFDINGKTIILIDDVLQAGRSIRAALDAINYFGRPAIVRLAALIDRGGREFPIQADYVGKTVQISAERRIRISWKEDSGTADFVYSTPTPKIEADL
ncbi:MAG: bifunctional pyr operon transcriptional regulator/uracil phosphoribosyltransferase PyrR [Lentisphaeria bacterium]|nr:bifunctional pyr operon transcriptional regulator/uracil phosphoribosyltransferase PyrR [Lentisphaeria bacterium]